MAYCAVSSMTAADWNEIRKLCKELRDYTDKKFDELDDGSLQTIKDSLELVQRKVSALEMTATEHGERLSSLEESAADTELTVSEVIDIYEGV